MGNTKRQRTENWIQKDKQILQHLVKQYVHIIENKNTDTNTNKKKTKAWDEIMNSFNELCLGSKRSTSQLKTQWSAIKLIAKQRQAEAVEYYPKTGAGDAPPPNILKSEDVENAEIKSIYEIDESPLLCRKELHTAQTELVLLQLNNERKRSK